MVIEQTEQTFTTGNGRRMYYGQGGDCYNTIWGSPATNDPICGVKGGFKVDVRGTGLRFDGQVRHIYPNVQSIKVQFALNYYS